jgi:hypothetical protein
MNITFTNTWGPGIETPQPASSHIPNWYKDLESYMGGIKKPDGQGNTTATIKRCMPVFDSITAGYIITSPVDVYVSIREYKPTNSQTGELVENLPTQKVQHFEWSAFDPIKFHIIEQAPNHPMKNMHAYAKWMSPWSIKTPKGYSTMFIQPMHRESAFTIFPGVVDTDNHLTPVNFPFVTNDPFFEGLIPRGTPIAQVIPFKRESWKLQLGGNKELQEQQESSNKLLSKLFDGYKDIFRQEKQYK